MDVGSNPVKCFVFFIIIFSKLVFYVSCICKELFSSFFRFVACCIDLLNPRLCFFIVFNLDLFVNREDSLMS